MSGLCLALRSREGGRDGREGGGGGGDSLSGNDMSDGHRVIFSSPLRDRGEELGSGVHGINEYARRTDPFTSIIQRWSGRSRSPTCSPPPPQAHVEKKMSVSQFASPAMPAQLCGQHAIRVHHRGRVEGDERTPPTTARRPPSVACLTLHNVGSDPDTDDDATRRTRARPI